MNEFLKIDWKVREPSKLEYLTQKTFIPEDVIADSKVYKTEKLQDTFPEIFLASKYIPGPIDINTNIKSALDQRGHQLCLEALKLIQSGKDKSCYNTKEQYCIDIANKLKKNILEENAKYQAYVSLANNPALANVIIDKRVLNFAQNICKRRKQQIQFYPQFYKEKSMINTTFNENEEIIEFNHIGNALELGRAARFCSPLLQSPCFLHKSLLSLSNHEANNPLISQDPNILKILENHPDINLVISSSGIKCLTDISDLKQWFLPVVIKTINIQNITKKVAFFDKIFTQNDVTEVDLAYKTYKRLIKSALLCPNSNENHCVTYRIWTIKKTHCQNNLMKNHHKPIEFKVLIRSKLDANDHNEQPLILKPKIELQLKYGANIPSKSELIHEWASLFFTPLASLYRVRLSPLKGEIICLENCSIQKVISEAQNHYHIKPQLGLGVLQRVFEDVIQLEHGNYLLRRLPKHGAFVTVLKESAQQDFDFYNEYDKGGVSNEVNWLPIDCNFILPSFEEAKRMPGMFSPRLTNVSVRQGKSKKKKNKVSVIEK